MDIKFIAHLLNGLLMILLGAGLGIFLYERSRRQGRPLNGKLWWIGAATFVLSQVGHLPFNFLLLNPLLGRYFPDLDQSLSLFVVASLLGLSAGLFEEILRYITTRYWARSARTQREALMLGAGHGGIEAIILGALVLLALLQMSAMRGMDLSALVPADQLAQLQQAQETYWGSPWYMNLLGALERVFAITLHVSLALMVMQAVTRRQVRWLLLAIFWHALVDAAAVASSVRIGAIWTEVVLAVMAVGGLIFALRLKDPPQPEPPPGTLEDPVQIDQGPEALVFEMPPVDEKDEDLDKSRYA